MEIFSCFLFIPQQKITVEYTIKLKISTNGKRFNSESSLTKILILTKLVIELTYRMANVRKLLKNLLNSKATFLELNL